MAELISRVTGGALLVSTLLLRWAWRPLRLSSPPVGRRWRTPASAVWPSSLSTLSCWTKMLLLFSSVVRWRWMLERLIVENKIGS